jgi:hypothetical protein
VTAGTLGRAVHGLEGAGAAGLAGPRIAANAGVHAEAADVTTRHLHSHTREMRLQLAGRIRR